MDERLQQYQDLRKKAQVAQQRLLSLQRGNSRAYALAWRVWLEAARQLGEAWDALLPEEKVGLMRREELELEFKRIARVDLNDGRHRRPEARANRAADPDAEDRVPKRRPPGTVQRKGRRKPQA